ncbi:hypothetical protein AVEN_255097-1 [Araneus ventricosus]|uniref:Uncharacterized protein n=1 Tax=Araneus ventricosus TaxID=182803 RepID=A0A4Y2EHA2_ARAVE|nr:hypothetical protein AVEN_255097-1 [Araneus ventricosus]
MARSLSFHLEIWSLLRANVKFLSFSLKKTGVHRHRQKNPKKLHILPDATRNHIRAGRRKNKKRLFWKIGSQQQPPRSKRDKAYTFCPPIALSNPCRKRCENGTTRCTSLYPNAALLLVKYRLSHFRHTVSRIPFSFASTRN